MWPFLAGLFILGVLWTALGLFILAYHYKTAPDMDDD
jgi:hypothetical protein